MVFMNRHNLYSWFGEKERALGFEPAAEFLPPARFKSGTNLVQDTAL